MGFKISWIAVETGHKQELLAAAGLQLTTERSEWGGPFEEGLSCADLPTGWTILFSNDFDYAAPEHLGAFTGDFPVLSCQVHEGIMYAASRCNRAGREVWAVSHYSEGGIYDLTVSGDIPAELAPIREAQIAKQEKTGGQDAGVDYIFDVPVGLIAALTGYKHDEGRFNYGEPLFVRAIRGR